MPPFASPPRAPGSVLHVVRRADRVTMPWRNGGGVTHELAREGDGAAGFAVRISLAEVAQDGPFSRFCGVDRVILLIDGAGFRLRRPDGLEVAVDRPGAPFSFHGEDDWACALVDGPTLDLNVMTDRATRRAAVCPRGPGQVDATWLLALEDGEIGDARVARLDLVRADGPVETTVPTIAVTITEVA